MRLFQRILLGVAAISAAGWLSASLVAVPQSGTMPMKEPMSMSGMQTKSMTKDQKIANAMSAQTDYSDGPRLDSPLLRPDQAAELLAVRTSWIYEAVRTGEPTPRSADHFKLGDVPVSLLHARTQPLEVGYLREQSRSSPTAHARIEKQLDSVLSSRYRRYVEQRLPYPPLQQPRAHRRLRLVQHSQ